MGFAPVFQRSFNATFDRRAAGITWLLRDDFTTDLAAGSVNGTVAEPGPGTRTVVDTYLKLQIASGELDFISGTATNGDPRYTLTPASPIARTAGRIALFDVKAAAHNFWLTFGGENVWFYDFLRINGTGGTIIGVNEAAVYTIASRSAGSFFVTKSGASTWRLRWITYSSTTTPLLPIVSQYNTTQNVGYVRVPNTLWLPTPLASDGFGSSFGTSDGLGHAEGIAGGIGAGGSGKTWSNVGGTWSVSGGKAINTAPSGLAQQISLADLAVADVFASVAVVRALSTNVGLALNWDSASSPANGVLIYSDGAGNIKVDKYVSGSPTTVYTAAFTYSAGASFVVQKAGTKYRIYYNNTFFVEATISDAGIVDNTLHGIFSTDAANTLDNLTIYATGTNGEYAELDKYTAD